MNKSFKGNEENAAEKKREQDEWEKKIGYSVALGQDTEELTGHKLAKIPNLNQLSTLGKLSSLGNIDILNLENAKFVVLIDLLLQGRRFGGGSCLTEGPERNPNYPPPKLMSGANSKTSWTPSRM